jgi:3-hydroxy-3-methylglutaryl CoA synthase
MTVTAGIENMNLYASTLAVDFSEIKKARGFSDKDFNNIRFTRRSVVPTYEDPVTLAVNAAQPIVDEIGAENFDLLVVATETGLDYGKPLSTYVHKYLGLKPSCRNFEVKHACYSGTAGLQTAASFVRSGSISPDKKVLLIMTDIGRRHFGEIGELSMGAGATALAIGTNPQVLELETYSGSATREVYDTARPTHSFEWIDPVLSLCAYLDLIEMAWNEYKGAAGDISFERHFNYMTYHTPLISLIEKAHQLLVEDDRDTATKDEIADSFDRMVNPSLVYNREVANTYSGSLYIAIAGLLESASSLKPGDRIGCFSYGSGACSEFFSGIVGETAREIVAAKRIGERLAARRKVSFEEYETAVKGVERGFVENEFEPDWNSLENHYEQAYHGKGLLVLDKVKNYYRTYKRS